MAQYVIHRQPNGDYSLKLTANIVRLAPVELVDMAIALLDQIAVHPEGRMYVARRLRGRYDHLPEDGHRDYTARRLNEITDPFDRG